MISRFKVGFILFVTLLFSLNVGYSQVLSFDPTSQTYTFEYLGEGYSGTLVEKFTSTEEAVAYFYNNNINLDEVSNLDDLDDDDKFEDMYELDSFSNFVEVYNLDGFDESNFLFALDLQIYENHEELREFRNTYLDFKRGDWDDVSTSEFNILLSNQVFEPNSLYVLYGEIKSTDDRDELESQERIIDLLLSDSDLLAKFYSDKDKDFETLLENKNACDGSVWNFFCVLNNKLTEREAFRTAFQNEINFISSTTSSVEEFNERLEVAANNLATSFFKNKNACGGSESCLDLLYEDESKFCSSLNTGVDCSLAKSLIRDAERKRVSEERIQVDSVYLFAESLLNPDQIGVDAARLFGFEADYSNLPPFIRDEIGASMCIGKINGYLDKNVESGGGVSIYEVQNTSSDVIVTADIRAQRTIVDPENKTALTYSYFIRAPEEFGLTYVVALSYTTSNGTEKITLENLQNVSAGEVASGFDNVKIPIANVDSLQKDSFTIGILGVRSGTTSKHISLTYPVILIESGDRYFQEGAISNDQGHSQVTGGGSNDNSLDDEDLLDILFT